MTDLWPKPSPSAGLRREKPMAKNPLFSLLILLVSNRRPRIGGSGINSRNRKAWMLTPTFSSAIHASSLPQRPLVLQPLKYSGQPGPVLALTAVSSKWDAFKAAFIQASLDNGLLHIFANPLHDGNNILRL